MTRWIRKIGYGNKALKTFWLVRGVKNSKYFHSRATQRHKRNKITGIYNSSGQWCTKPDEVADSLIAFYQDLFTSSNPVSNGAALSPVEKIVTDEMNIQLSHEFTTLEVQIALKQMTPLKAPSPDSMPPIFYQNYWDLIGSDVSQTILSYLNSASLPHPLNHTFITLIPKVKSPVSVTKYQPISLYNVFYKIFSKVLANRFKKILPSIITEHQSAFTKNFLISDNILIAFGDMC